MKRILIVGAGFTGSVIANELARAGIAVTVIDSRNHLGGNCYTYVDEDTGITVHKYGPHIFHTDNEEVWSYVNKLAEFKPFICRMKATVKNDVYSLPVNLHTINQFYGKTFSPAEARQFVDSIARVDIEEPKTFEEQALRFVGPGLYEAFFKGYPQKQWGLHPSKLPASVLKRLPVRFDYDDNYFFHKYQAIPNGGYTQIFERLLVHPNIEVKLNCGFHHDMRTSYDHVFFSGPIDGWFDFKYGQLGYRTLEFVRSVHDGDYQGCAVMSYPDLERPYTRISEHKHFTPWEKHSKTVIFEEYSRDSRLNDDRYYPIRLAEEQKMLSSYLEHARNEKNVSFVGRLGTYRYIDMDVTIKEALNASKNFLLAVGESRPVPVFFEDTK
ncbi:UDP-galactopyranose mutase [Rhizobium sp. PP-WC-1G-195]|nr:UDP-galactopyranose mutase [Rhizobium sp. PP-WC-1G-195]TCP74190.1 UDP-galactopyranose mutase [Rhizobium sp. PP-CC-2G-626]